MREALGYQYIGKNTERLQEFLDEGFTIVKCDASYKDSVGSSSVSIEKKDKSYKPKHRTFKAQGPVHAELTAILHGIRAVQNIKHTDKVLVVNDNVSAVSLASGGFTPQKSYIKEVVEKIGEVQEEAPAYIAYGWVRSKVTKKVDKAAKRTLRTKEEEINERIEKRIKDVEKKRKKSRALSEYRVLDQSSVRIKSEKSSYWYLVSFDSVPSCSCYWWKHNWGNKDEKIVKARSLPCKHMCKAAEVLGFDIFEIFKRQIFRRT